MKTQLREIVTNCTGIDTRVLGDQGDLWQAGMTSKRAVRMMLEIEEELGVEFPPESLSHASFATINSIEGVLRPLVEVRTEQVAG